MEEVNEVTYNTLSLEQKYAFEKFRQGENIFITGPGGTGKSRLIQFMTSWANMQNLKMTVCAMTGCAAVLLNCGACTIHSWSGIRLAKGDIGKIIAGVLRNRKASKNWKTTQILVLDEVSMLSVRIFNLLNAIGKKVRQNNRPFGGIQLVFTGDFYQLPPVGSDPDPDASKFCFQSDQWNVVFPLINCIELKTMFRQTDQKYIEILQQIRVGALSPENAEYLSKYVKREYDPSEYGGMIPTKLYALRNIVDGVNKKMFSALEKEEYEYGCIVKTDCDRYLDGTGATISLADLKNGIELVKSRSDLDAEIQLLRTLTQTPDTLSLKEGAVVMCTSNLALELGVCNGSQGIIIGFGNSNEEHGFAEVPIVQFSNGVKMKIPIQYRHSHDYPTVAIGQIPLCLAWALTIHKIQGATISMAQMDVGKTIFEYGQTYVALSRIKSLDGLYLSSFMPEKIRAHPDVIAFYSNLQQITPEQMNQYIANHRYNGLPYFAPQTRASTLSHLPSHIHVIRNEANTPNPFTEYSMPQLPFTTKTIVVKKSPSPTTDF